MGDHVHRQKLEHAFAGFGWPKEALWVLMEEWYRLLPEPSRFFGHGAYYQSMRPRPKGCTGAWTARKLRKADGLLNKMKRRKLPMTVFEERHSHKVIRDAMWGASLRQATTTVVHLGASRTR